MPVRDDADLVRRKSIKKPGFAAHKRVQSEAGSSSSSSIPANPQEERLQKMLQYTESRIKHFAEHILNCPVRLF